MGYYLAPILPESIYDIAEADRPSTVVDCVVAVVAAAAGDGRGDMMAGKGFIVYGGSDLRRLLRDVEDRYGGAFDELGPGRRPGLQAYDRLR